LVGVGKCGGLGGCSVGAGVRGAEFFGRGEGGSCGGGSGADRGVVACSGRRGWRLWRVGGGFGLFGGGGRGRGGLVGWRVGPVGLWV